MIRINYLMDMSFRRSGSARGVSLTRAVVPPYRPGTRAASAADPASHDLLQASDVRQEPKPYWPASPINCHRGRRNLPPQSLSAMPGYGPRPDVIEVDPEVGIVLVSELHLIAQEHACRIRMAMNAPN
jgi:hypothetical protein